MSIFSSNTATARWRRWVYERVGDYNLNVLEGKVDGHSMIIIRGHDDTVPNGGPFGLSPSFGGNSYSFDQSAIAATPAAISVASTDNTNDNSGGTGALTVRITGLDANGDIQNVDETLTGTTKVTTSETWSAYHKHRVLTTGTNNSNTGTIWVGTGTFTAGVPAVRMGSMEVGHNKSATGYYVVPAGHTLYLRQFISTVATSNKDVEVSLATSTDGSQWYIQSDFGIEAGDFTTPVIAIRGLPAGTHIRLEAKGSAASTGVTAILAGELVED